MQNVFFFFSSFNLDPRAYQTVWGFIFGFMVLRMAVWGVGQTTVQRAVAAKSLKDAKLYVAFDDIVFCFLMTLANCKTSRFKKRENCSLPAFTYFIIFIIDRVKY